MFTGLLEIGVSEHMIDTCLRYIETSKVIAGATSKSPILTLARLLLYRLVTGYGPDHYTTYSQFRKPVDFSRWREYVDKKDLCKILFEYNRRSSFKVLENKVDFYRKCLKNHLPQPTVRFTVNHTSPSPDLNDYRDGDIAIAFESLPRGDYIVKTCSGSYGLNLWSITRTNAGIQLHNDETLLSPDQFSRVLVSTGESYLVQDKVEVSRHLRGIMPGRACGSIRINSFAGPDGTIVTPYVFLKLTTIGPVSDNFSNGTSGNMLAIIDPCKLSIARVIGKGDSGLLETVTHHPDTGVDLRNHHVRELEKALNLARRCAQIFIDIPAVGWDIVLTEQGAMVLEGNPMFDPIGPQLCADRGVRYSIPNLLKSGMETGFISRNEPVT